MNTDVARLLARYNAHANGEMHKILAALSPDEWAKDRGGFYPSFRKLLEHLYAADVAWLVRFTALHPFKAVKGDPFDFPPSPGSVSFPTFAEYESARKRVDEAYLSFAEELTDADFGQTLNYRNFKGEAMSKPAGGTVLHVFNHQTHHRGMVALYLDQMGVANDFSNIVSILQV